MVLIDNFGRAVAEKYVPVDLTASYDATKMVEQDLQLSTWIIAVSAIIFESQLFSFCRHWKRYRGTLLKHTDHTYWV